MTPVGTSNRTIPAVNAALAMNASVIEQAGIEEKEGVDPPDQGGRQGLEQHRASHTFAGCLSESLSLTVGVELA